MSTILLWRSQSIHKSVSLLKTLQQHCSYGYEFVPIVFLNSTLECDHTNKKWIVSYVLKPSTYIIISKFIITTNGVVHSRCQKNTVQRDFQIKNKSGKHQNHLPTENTHCYIQPICWCLRAVAIFRFDEHTLEIQNNIPSASIRAQNIATPFLFRVQSWITPILLTLRTANFS